MEDRVDHEALLKELGYSDLWLEGGLIDVEGLATQHQSLRSGEDPHAEHHRINALRTFVASKRVLDPATVDLLARIISQERDPLVRSGMLLIVLNADATNDAQFESLCADPFLRNTADAIAFLVDRARMLRRMRTCPSDTEMLRFCARSPDRYLQEAAIMNERIIAEDAEYLTVAGLSRRIRHFAKDLIRRRRKDQSVGSDDA